MATPLVNVKLIYSAFVTFHYLLLDVCQESISLGLSSYFPFPGSDYTENPKEKEVLLNITKPTQTQSDIVSALHITFAFEYDHFQVLPRDISQFLYVCTLCT